MSFDVAGHVRAGCQNAEWRLADLWIESVAMGANIGLGDLRDIASGRRAPSRGEYEILAATLNEHLSGIGKNHPMVSWNATLAPTPMEETDVAKILTATDGSAFTIDAARRALPLLPAASELTVLAVVPPMSLVIGLTPATDFGEALIDPQQAAVNAQSEADATIAALHPEAHSRVEHGDPATTICDVATTGGST